MSPIALPATADQPKIVNPRAAAPAGATDFALPVVAVLAAVAPEATVVRAPPKGPKLAADGKGLPDVADKDEKADKDVRDPAFSWMPILTLPVQPKLIAPGFEHGVSRPNLPIELHPAPRPSIQADGEASTVVQADGSRTELTTTNPAPHDHLAVDLAGRPGLGERDDAKVAALKAAGEETAAVEDGTPSPIRPTAPAVQPQLPPVPAVTQSAGQVFAAAMLATHPETVTPPEAPKPGKAGTPLTRAAADAPARQRPTAVQPATAPSRALPDAKRDTSVQSAIDRVAFARGESQSGDTRTPLTPTVIDTVNLVRTNATPTVSESHRAPLDLKQDAGLLGMIDRIETLRDNADSTDTRIRLTPAGLGTVDVAVRKDGDIVHVHFTAEQPATRTLIADAQPRLAELAEARGIRLGETSVTGGGADAQAQTQAQAQQQALTRQNAAAPRSAFATDHDTTDADSRVA